MKSLKKGIFIFCIIICTLCIGKNVLALEDGIKSIEMEYTEEYIEWLKLSDEEKENVIMPRKYKIESVNSKPSKSFYSLKSSPLEDKFCLTQYIPKNVTAKNQKNTGSCWAFSGMGALESTLALNDYKKAKKDGTEFEETTYDFSETHLIYSSIRDFLYGEKNSYGQNKSLSGGNPRTVVNYLTNGMGAISEEEMKFVDYETKMKVNQEQNIELSEIQEKHVITKVNDTIDFPTCDPTTATQSELDNLKNLMKTQIKEHGGIMAAIYGAQTSSEFYSTQYSSMYCDDKSKEIDHQVLIIGWDDTFDKTHFPSGHQPEKNGAWIIKNSWGTNFGNNGLMYISYEDVNIYTYLIGIENASTEINYDNIYQYDEVGHNMIPGIAGTNIIYLASVFDKKTTEDEYLTEVSLYCPQKYECTVYINENGTTKASTRLTPVTVKDNTDTITTSVVLNEGYHTIKLAKPIKVSSKFVVGVKLTGLSTFVVDGTPTNNRVYYILEKNGQTSGGKKDGQYYAKNEVNKCFWTTASGYISGDEGWYDLSDTTKANSMGYMTGDLTIKAFTAQSSNFEGTITSFGTNEEEETKIELYELGSTSPSYQCNVKGNGDKDFIIENVKYGTYTLKFTKKDHVTREYQITVSANNEKENYKIHLKGDIDGNGKVNVGDSNKIHKHILKSKLLTDYEFLCADIDGNGKVNVGDSNKVHKHILKAQLLFS